MRQEQALAILKTGRNVFLTGEPGSGKTHVTGLYVKYLREHRIGVAVTASTGIAATHLGGMTIHSWSGIGIRKKLDKRDIKLMKKKKWLASRVNKTKVLIIDEISMMDANTLNLVDLALRGLRESERPFGGLQVVLVGDFFQLPPVVREGEVEFAFGFRAWQEAVPLVCYLGEQHRQSEDEFLELLGLIRRGEVDYRVQSLLESRVKNVRREGLNTRLYSHNRDVDSLNSRYLERIESSQVGFEMEVSGPKALVEQLIKGCLSPQSLVLKKGAKVMFTKNNFEEGFVNGTLGEVVGFEDEDRPVVATKEGRVIEVEAMEWRIEEGEKTLASVSQLPLRLAWAITVHKSQGMSLDGAVVDLRRAFEYGQGYVALSRVRTLGGLILEGFNQISMRVHPQILEVDSEFRKLSERVVKRLESIGDKELKRRQREFIVRSGGKLGKQKVNRRGVVRTGSTYTQTLELVEQGLGVAEIAGRRGFVEKTIVNHLEKLAAEGRVSKGKLKKLMPNGLASELPKIQGEFRKLGVERLKPVYERFAGKYDYEDLRWARMLM